MRLATVAFANVVFGMFALVDAATQRVGDECNWSKNCASPVAGVGPAWANGEVTCAVPQPNKPESCGSGDKKHRNDFYGICKAVGTLDATEYGCACGVHNGNCPTTSPFSRIFWPQDWLPNAWKDMHS